MEKCSTLQQEIMKKDLFKDSLWDCVQRHSNNS